MLNGAQRLRLISTAELFLAASLWGFGFIGTVWSLQVMSAFQLSLVRFALASSVGLFFLLRVDMRRAFLGNWRLSFLPGFFLFLTLYLQTWGLHYTTATKSGFITTLYVVFVPILESFMHKRPLPLTLWICVIASLIGTGLIVNVGFEAINFGDILTFLCAIFATVQIYYLSVVSPKVKRPFIFNVNQTAWAALLALPVIFFEPLQGLPPIPQWPMTAFIGLIGLVGGSTLIAFFLQVRAQAHLTPTVSSLLFLLESPFALVFAAYFLGETMGFTESIGALLIFCSAVGASLIPKND
jgi:drug/metabolite transporter (DMT)-like permease